jgi:hypothetical protein
MAGETPNLDLGRHRWNLRLDEDSFESSLWRKLSKLWRSHDLTLRWQARGTSRGQ